jgi:hypothetical protein
VTVGSGVTAGTVLRGGRRSTAQKERAAASAVAWQPYLVAFTVTDGRFGLDLLGV